MDIGAPLLSVALLNLDRTQVGDDARSAVFDNCEISQCEATHTAASKGIASHDRGRERRFDPGRLAARAKLPEHHARPRPAAGAQSRCLRQPGATPLRVIIALARSFRAPTLSRIRIAVSTYSAAAADDFGGKTFTHQPARPGPRDGDSPIARLGFEYRHRSRAGHWRDRLGKDGLRQSQKRSAGEL